VLTDAGLAEAVKAAAAGDAAAWKQLVDRFAGLVWIVARSHALAAAVAGDVAQTCWLRLTESLEDVPADQVGAWLASGARTESLHALRWNDPRWDTAPRPNRPPALSAALEQLPARSRVAVEMAAVPGISPLELGAAVGLPPADAQALASEALARLDLHVAEGLRDAEPVPSSVVSGALAAYSWRTEGEGTASSYDSLLDEQLTVRSGSGARLLTFAWAGGELDLEVTQAGARRSLLGQLSRAGADRVLVRHGGATETAVDVDDGGRFALTDLAPGALSVHVGTGVRTAWVLV
jgi:DNA-directed RNA polymerase specialized sigma24 family protein